jgi:hypothetical protein
MMGRTRNTTAASMLRWLAAWLALALCAQALALGTAALRGLGHRHGTLELETKPMLLWRHAGDHTTAADAHARAHAAGDAHLHADDDASVLGSDAFAAALAAFVSAPAPRAHAAHAMPGLRHVWSAAVPWSATARTVTPPLRPPHA